VYLLCISILEWKNGFRNDFSSTSLVKTTKEVEEECSFKLWNSSILFYNLTFVFVHILWPAKALSFIFLLFSLSL
jgi:hypothetical protein